MPKIFETGFESGDLSDFDEVTQNLGFATVEQFPYSGVYSGKFTIDPTLVYAYVRAYKYLNMPVVFARGLFYISQGLPLPADNDRFYFIRIHNAAGLYVATVGLRRSEGNPTRWVIAGGYLENGEQRFYEVYGLSAPPNAGEWICIELVYDSINNLVELYINGKLEISIAMNFTETGNANAVAFGITAKPGQTDSPPSNSLYTVEVFADEIAIGNTYIGPPEGPACYVDADCPEGYICQDGVCVKATPPPPPCFIATAAFGTSLAKEINVLRIFRDNFILRNKCGAGLVQLYYVASPPFADFIRKHGRLRSITRILLKPVVEVARRRA